jgi:hypothetical protein
MDCYTITIIGKKGIIDTREVISRGARTADMAARIAAVACMQLDPSLNTGEAFDGMVQRIIDTASYSPKGFQLSFVYDAYGTIVVTNTNQDALSSSPTPTWG